jgi:hypothetical protein
LGKTGGAAALLSAFDGLHHSLMLDCRFLGVDVEYSPMLRENAMRTAWSHSNNSSISSSNNNSSYVVTKSVDTFARDGEGLEEGLVPSIKYPKTGKRLINCSSEHSNFHSA